jgi:phage shock protein PspC (stress-responsive transcriptional regulator)
VDEARAWFRGQGLVRPASGRWLAGVCLGIARRLGLPALVVRAAFVASLFLPGPQVLVYLALWVLMPSATAEDSVVAGS